MKTITLTFTLLLAICAAAFAGEPEAVRRHDLTTLTSSDVYTSERGHGFDLGTNPGDGTRPFCFSVAVPEGNYRVSVTFGHQVQASDNTVKAESRRLMVEGLKTAPGELVTRSFIVNVRNRSLPPPERNAPGGSAVVLNEREQGALHWDDKLTLEFNGAAPRVSTLVVERAEVPTVFLVGDSTVTDQPREPGASWGQMLPRFFKPEVVIANHAESGETMKSFLSGLRLAKVLSQMKAGDYLFIQFGHNDQKKQWPQTYVEAGTTYRAYLRAFIAEARLRGATPVLVTSMQRRQFDERGRIRNSHGDYPEAVRAVARDGNVALIDLERMSVALYEALGPEKAPLAFAADGRDATHHNNYGAYELAKCVVQGIRNAGLPLAGSIIDDFAGFDPARPDPVETFSLAQSPTVASATPAPDLASNPIVQAATINRELPTIFIAGDSTAARGSGNAQQGWAVPFADYFDLAKINVVNRARGGRSSRTFITEGLWDQLLADVKTGDVVLIQFGHNDGGAINEEPPGSNRPLRARGSLPGLGEESQEIDNVLTKKHEVVHTFGWYMRKMIADTQARGARPIVLSLTLRNIWRDGRIERGSGRYGWWSYQIAKDAGVPLLDVTNVVADRFEDMGEPAVKALYERDHTHFNAAGADLHAAAVVSGLKGLRPRPVANLLSAKGEAVEADRLVWLNLPRPADSRLPSLFLIGDSTVRNGRGDGAGGQWGWGDSIGAHFDPEKINVVNRAVGGLSSRTYLTQGHWDHIMRMLKPGDFVMMQFGHNDAGPLNDDRRARGTIRGVGDETEEIDNRLTHQHEVVHSYGWYLRTFIADTRAKGATPIVCSLVPRKTWRDGRIVRNKDSYAGWAEAVARAERVAFIDLNEIIAQRYDALGADPVESLFADEHTHTGAAGAELNAQCVVDGLASLDPNPLQAFLRGTGTEGASP